VSETTLIQDRIFIDGEWAAPHSAEVISVENPYDRSIIGSAPDGSAEDVDRAVRAARAAFDHGPWPRMTGEERGVWMERLADALEERASGTVSLIVDEIGQPASVAGFMAGVRPVQHLRFYAELARGIEFETRRPNRDRGGDSLLRREPVGVAALIVPWNHPQSSTSIKMAPALAAGCTVVIKPASESPLDIARLADAAASIGFPAGVINIVPGGRETGRMLVSHPGIDKVAFTGSTAAGRHIASVCGERLIPATLELGGKSAAIVLEGSDIAQTLAALRAGSFGNTGQNCIALTRVLAPASLYDELLDGLVDLARDLRVGDPKDAATEIGPLINEAALTRVTGIVDRARHEGARILAGDTAAPDGGYFFAPRIVADAAPESEIAQNEIFGPVVSIHRYTDVDDAVRIANGTPYGLGGAVFGEPERAVEVARRIRTGSIGIDGYRADINLPFGGVGASGIGRELGPEALQSYLRTKSIFL